MAFTQDEIQALNTILEQKLSQHQRELEHTLEQHMQTLRYEFEQRLTLTQQEVVRAITHKLTEQQGEFREIVTQGMETVEPHIAQAVSHEVGLRQQQYQQQGEAFIENTLAAQLLAVEQLLQQQLSRQIEVQTELPWEDFVDIIGKALDERLSVLDNSLRSAISTMQQYVTSSLHEVHEALTRERVHPYGSKINTMQDVLVSIEQLERLIESLQAVMTANHAILSNRLYHHQHLPPERAHGSGQASETQQPA
jgi:hypothetical protein